MAKEIIVPESLLPKPQPYRNCECMKQPIDLTAKKGTITWLVEVGEAVKEGQTVCEGEVDKKTVEIKAPVSGILKEILIEDEHVFKAGDVVGYIENK